MMEGGEISPLIPQYGGVKGEHNATEVVFVFQSNVYDAGNVARLSFRGGDGTVVSSDLLTVVEDVQNNYYSVSYLLPKLITALGGQVELRVVFSQIDDSGEEVVTFQSAPAVLYFDDAAVENGTPFWTGVSEMLKSTVTASGDATLARDAAEAAAAVAAENVQEATAAREDAQAAAVLAVETAEEVTAAKTDAHGYAVSAMGYARSAQQQANTAAVAADAAKAARDEAQAIAADLERGVDGYTPQRGVDYWTDADLSVIATDISAEVADQLADKAQLEPIVVNSIDECIDTTKLYVLPDGYIYAYMLTEIEAQPLFTNLLPLAVDADGTPYNGGLGYKEGYRLSSSGVETETDGCCMTGYIPSAVPSATLRFKNMPQSLQSEYIHYYKEDFTRGSAITYESAMYADVDENGVYTVTLTAADYQKYIRITAGQMTEDTIITINEEIAYSEASIGYAWVNTGHAFVPADYEDRILDLEAMSAAHTVDIEKLKRGITDVDDPLTYIRNWDAPIYDCTPVWEITSEKAALTAADKTVAAVYAKYDALMAENPDFITRTDLGLCSDGVTPVYRYDFCEREPRHQSGFEWSETKVKFIVVTGIHREWNGIYAMYHALAEIAANSELADLRRNMHFIVVPVLNPYSISGDYSVVGHALNANGVEIHRNFEVGFSVSGEGTIHYTGETPLSEVESQYLDDILRENTDAAYFLTCHSFDRDKTWGVGFLWGSSATKYMCNMAFRVIDKMGKAWHKKYGTIWEEGIASQNAYLLSDTDAYPNATALEDGDYRIGHAALTNTGGCEQRQATKYGIQATNFEVGETFFVLDETALSAKAITHGAEAYINFFLTALGCYDNKDKALYSFE